VTTDLFLPVTIVGHPIVREADGLAMSSRNAYLSAPDRARALCLSRALRIAQAAFAKGERDPQVIERAARAEVERGADTIDYVSVVDAKALAPLAKIADRALVAIACRVGKTRLIDNFVLGEDDPLGIAPRAPLG
jgi:pantoate--beta-alanine ligase